MNLPYASLADMQLWARAQMLRKPDFVIGDPAAPYMLRWFVLPRNEQCNVYLHSILRSDEDRAGHDHPWDNTSFVIDGSYEEITFDVDRPWLEWDSYTRTAGDVLSRKATDTHRLIIPDGQPAISLFMTGPKVREWGFWCPEGKGWVHYRDFTAGEHGEIVGRGCGD